MKLLSGHDVVDNYVEMHAESDEGAAGILADEVLALRAVLAEVPKCAICGEVAACMGSYEADTAFEAAFACSGCCGHGNEDGWCVPVADAADKRNSEVEWMTRHAENDRVES